jgi:uncharacterized protein YkwD
MRHRHLLVTALLSLAAIPASASAASPTLTCDAGLTGGAPSGVAAVCPGADVLPTPANVAVVRKATLCLLNRARTSRGLTKLSSQPVLTTMAARYATTMALDDFFDHTTPDGRTFDARIRSTSYVRGAVRRWTAGENIAYGTEELATPAQIHDAWMHSPGHKRNILDRSFREVGIGVALGSPVADIPDDGAATYATEFGRRER